MGNFRKLKVWEKAHGLAVRSHRVAKSMRSPLYASIRNQIIRAAESVPTNIVEGSRKATNTDFARFLDYALSSASELEYHLILSRDIGAISDDESSSMINDVTEVRKMLHGLIRRLKSSPPSDSGKKTLHQNNS
jgi:four helix bundle protein